ncbi:MAG: hypothetical protein VX899_09950 [Myxococcota bacterium]|nr:hypothetical protein [Myxococcota bacterium]
MKLRRLDHTEPCPVCGALCGGSIRFRFHHPGGEEVVFEMNREVFAFASGPVVQQAFKAGTYPELPGLIREANECRGWEDAGGEVERPALELLSTVRCFLGVEQGPLVDVAALEALRGFAEEAVGAGVPTVWALWD